VAEVFLTAWRRLDAVPEGDAARVWLYATARRVVANQHRSRRRHAALRERLALEAATARPAHTVDREAALVHEALRRLRPAAVLGCRAVTARGRLRRARRRFRSIFDELRAPVEPRRSFAQEGPEHV
jgi:RNA polymerase sigma-70 factor, ECF subfamily